MSIADQIRRDAHARLDYLIDHALEMRADHGAEIMELLSEGLHEAEEALDRRRLLTTRRERRQ